MLSGTVIDNMVMGGPAYNSDKLCKGDVILEVENKPVTAESVHDALLGNDLPGTTLKIKVKRIGDPSLSREPNGGGIEVPLTRMASEVIADKRQMFELFTALKVLRFDVSKSLQGDNLQITGCRIALF
jgi:C-terminal processing protease CtpA/Prc